MSAGGRVLGGNAAWLTDAVTHPAGRIAGEVSEQLARLTATAGSETDAVLLMPPALAKETLQRNALTGEGYLPVHGLPVLLCYEVGGPVVISRWLVDAIVGEHPTVLFE
jgi:hypothetical protein